MTQSEKATLFRRLHQSPPILRLSNVWDAASARIVERAGFPAIGTSSAGIAFALAYPDGERIPPGEMLEQVRRITRAVNLPVSADLEAGYDELDRAVAGLLEAGAIGLNLEDFEHEALVERPRQLERLGAVRRVGEAAGVPLVINARCDIYLRQIGDESTRFARTVERLSAYRDAGADCLFVPGVRDEVTIAGLVEALRFPVNILAVPGTPPAARLEELGVARVSLGSGPMRAVMGLTRRIAEELRDSGDWTRMIADPVTYADANELMG